MPINVRKLACWLICFVAMLVYFPPAVHAAIISTNEEIKIGQGVAKNLEEKFGLVDDPALQQRVTAIGEKIVAVSDRKDLKYTFKVLNTSDINALALPGGFVYIFKGLVDYMPSDDELAGVIGHEVSHIAKRHTVKQIEQNLMVTLIFGLIFGDRGALLQNLAFNAIMAGYSRDDEREADRFGFIYALNSGYNPYGMEITQAKLAALAKTPNYGLFSSHPEPENRIALLKKYAQDAKIKPIAVANGENARVADGQWLLPEITATEDGYKPLYRAYFTAGALYRVSQRPDLSADWLVLDTDGTNYTVYYDDIKIITLTPQDAAQAGVDLLDLANTYITKLREWIRGQV